MLHEVGHSGLESLDVLLGEVFLGNSAVTLKCSDSCNEYNCRRLESRSTALDVEELLGTEIRTEACLSNNIITECESHLGSHNGITAVRDVCKRSAVNKSGCMFKCLYKVGLDGILEERSHSALCLKVSRGNGLTFGVVTDNDTADTCLKIREIVRKAKDSHDLGSNRDVVAVLTGHAVRASAKTVNHVTELSVVHVDTSSPCDASCIDIEGIALIDVVVKHSSKEIVGCADRMHISREMKVDILHGNYLCVSAACSTALDTEDRSE